MSEKAMPVEGFPVPQDPPKKKAAAERMFKVRFAQNRKYELHVGGGRIEVFGPHETKVLAEDVVLRSEASAILANPRLFILQEVK